MAASVKIWHFVVRHSGKHLIAQQPYTYILQWFLSPGTSSGEQTFFFPQQPLILFSSPVCKPCKHVVQIRSKRSRLWEWHILKTQVTFMSTCSQYIKAQLDLYYVKTVSFILFQTCLLASVFKDYQLSGKGLSDSNQITAKSCQN